MTSVSDSGVTLGSYVYNALGQRTSKTVGSTETDFVYGLTGKLIGEYQDGTLVREYVWLGDSPIAQADSGSLLYLHGDQLETPREATDSNGVVVWRWVSDGFGLVAPDEDPDGDALLTDVSLRFPGQYWDSEAELSYNYFRTYDPTIGRYTQSDPVRDLIRQGVVDVSELPGNRSIEQLSFCTFVCR